MSDVVNEESHRWKSRGRLSVVISVGAFAIPLALSVAVSVTVSLALPRPDGGLMRVLWWAVVLVSATIAVLTAERFSRRLLPLAALLKMSLLFPDKVPSRLAVARKAGSTRDLERYLHGTSRTRHREPMAAAAEILVLAVALSKHDRRTRGHSEQVRVYSDLIGRELRLSTADRDRLRWTALLHDIGKLSVHPDILNKAGKPTDEEWEQLKRHPLEGRRLIEPIQAWLGEWSLTVEQHHERFDGSGYPFGLAGEEISLGARIVAVADAFEVMTATRSYKSAVSAAAARRELTRCAGTQFDPAIVRAFLDISIDRLRWVIGPISWLFDIPIVGQLGNLARTLVVSSQVAAVAGSVAVATVAASPQYRPPWSRAGALTVSGTYSATRSPGAVLPAGAWIHIPPASGRREPLSPKPGNSPPSKAPASGSSTTTLPALSVRTDSASPPPVTSYAVPTTTSAARHATSTTLHTTKTSATRPRMPSTSTTEPRGSTTTVPATTTTTTTTTVPATTTTTTVPATTTTVPVPATAPLTGGGITYSTATGPTDCTSLPFGPTKINDVDGFPNAVCSSIDNQGHGTYSWTVELAAGSPGSPVAVTTESPVVVTITGVTVGGTNQGSPPTGPPVGSTATIPPGSSVTSTAFGVGNIGGGDWIQVTASATIGSSSSTLEMQVH